MYILTSVAVILQNNINRNININVVAKLNMIYYTILYIIELSSSNNNWRIMYMTTRIWNHNCQEICLGDSGTGPWLKSNYSHATNQPQPSNFYSDQIRTYMVWLSGRTSLAQCSSVDHHKKLELFSLIWLWETATKLKMRLWIRFTEQE